MKISQLEFGRLAPCLVIAFSLIQGVFFTTKTLGQTQGYYDSLNSAKTLLDQGEIKISLELLNVLEKNYSWEENLIRVKGQALYWSKDFEGTKSYFRKSLESYPNLYWARLDYARILYELQEWNEAQEMFEECLKINPDEPETNQKLAELNYWKGGKPKKSLEFLHKILVPFPENAQANSLKKEIKTMTSPYLGISGGYYSDSQPLEYFNVLAKGNFYHSAALQPGFLAEFRSYNSGISVQVIQASNKFSLPKTNTSLLLRAGISNSSDWGNSELIFGAEVRQKLPKNLEINLSADQEAYFFTLASLSQPIIPMTLRAGLGRETGDSWTGKILWQNSAFQDNNSVNTFGGWVLFPVLRKSVVRFDLGYSLSLSDSDEVRFSEDLPISNTPSATEIGEVIPGSYNPYFTPINQQIHGVLGKMLFDLSPKINFSLRGNIGVYAKIDNPNMVYYGSTGQNPNAPISPDDIYLILVETKYNPMDFNAVISWKNSPKSAFSLSYIYQKTVFFDSNSIELNYNVRIWNDR